MSYVIGIMIVLSVVFSLLLGRAPEVSGAALTAGVEAVRMCFELMGTVAMWNGIMRIAEKSGLVVIIERLLSPVTKLLFGGLAEKSPKAMSAISLNMTANLLGLGAAATPTGLEAMKELDRINGGSEEASGYMIALVALNTASFQIIPTTVAAIRKLAGASSPMDILPAVWITSLCSVTAAVSTALLFNRRRSPRLNNRGGAPRSSDRVGASGLDIQGGAPRLSSRGGDPRLSNRGCSTRVARKGKGRSDESQ